jgi:hypothetical protein
MSSCGTGATNLLGRLRRLEASSWEHGSAFGARISFVSACGAWESILGRLRRMRAYWFGRLRRMGVYWFGRLRRLGV